MTLTPCTDVSAAAWITGSELPWQQLVTFGPSGFGVYARLRFLPDPDCAGQPEVSIDDDAPSEHDLLRTALDVLRQHTRTPDDCYFCLWDGWGSDIDGDDAMQALDLGMPSARPERYRDPPEPTRTARPSPRIAPAFPPSVLTGPKVEIPARAYFLFQGTLSEFGDWGAAEMSPGHPRSFMPDPAFIWPADHAWCVANDVDPHDAGIGAASTAVDDLLAHPDLDVVRADSGVEPPHYG